ncbi:MAG: ABC transporter permease subunit [Kosmotoga sp.]|nr:MAG: ABC transporter permease subunit [Kosmotoga sp.]
MSGKKFLIYLLAMFFLAIYNAFVIWGIFVLWINARYGLAIVLVALMLIIDYITFSRKGYPYRYMIPALILLFVLTIYPMYYTFDVAFTNYGTGHLFTRPEVVQRLLNEYFYVPDDPVEYDFWVFVKLENYKPTEDFVMLFKEEGSENRFIAPRPDVISRDSDGNISLARSEMFRVENNSASINGINYEIVVSKKDGNYLSINNERGENFVYFYSPNDPSTRANAAFFLGEIRSDWLKNAEFINPQDYQVRLNPKTLYRNFATVERQYGMKTVTSLDAGYARQEQVLYNRQTGKNLVEKNGYFYDVRENGEEVRLDGYISGVGFDNFMKMISDPRVRGPFFQIFVWTFTWAGLSVVFCFTIGLSLAMVLNDRKLKGTKIYRTLLIIPWAIPAFISVLVWRNGMFNETYGILNRFLFQGLLGFEEPIRWLSDPFWAKVSVLTVNTWLGFPYMMTVSLGALQSIPGELYEAASIDGARRWQKFWKITFPLLMVAVAPLLVGTFAFNFNNFVGIYLLTEGGPAIPGSTTPAGATDILISYTYKLAFYGRGQDFGFASAISIIIFGLVAGFSWLNFKLSGAFEEVRR